MEIKDAYTFLLPILGTTVLVTGCASSSQYPINESYGPEPKLPEPKTSLFPTVNIAPAQGWPSGVMPTPAEGLKVKHLLKDLSTHVGFMCYQMVMCWWLKRMLRLNLKTAKGLKARL